MKVKIKCERCGRISSSYAVNIKNARAIKRRCKENKFICWKCVIKKRCEEF